MVCRAYTAATNQSMAEIYQQIHSNKSMLFHEQCLVELCTANISFDVVVMGFIFGTLAVGFTNGGLGAYPLAIASILSLYGISEGIGTAFGYLIWVSQTLLTIFLGLLSYLLLPILNKK